MRQKSGTRRTASEKIVKDIQRVMAPLKPGYPRIALDRMERDAEWAAQWARPEQISRTARRFIGEGTGWMRRLCDATI